MQQCAAAHEQSREAQRASPEQRPSTVLVHSRECGSVADSRGQASIGGMRKWPARTPVHLGRRQIAHTMTLHRRIKALTKPPRPGEVVAAQT